MPYSTLLSGKKVLHIAYEEKHLLQKRIGELGRRLGSFLSGPHCVLFVSSFVLVLTFGLSFVWSIKAIEKGEIYLAWVPLVFLFFSWNTVIRRPEYLLMLYHRTIWVLVKKRIKSHKAELLDPNKPHLRDGLITLIQVGYALGALISFLDFV